MNPLRLKTIHGKTFPRYALVSSLEDTQEKFLVSPAQELLKAYHSLWSRELKDMVQEAKQKNSQLPFLVESLTLEAVASTVKEEAAYAQECRKYKKTLSSRLCLKLRISPSVLTTLYEINTTTDISTAASDLAADRPVAGPKASPHPNEITFYIDIPYLSPQGTFIFLGNDYVYVNRLTQLADAPSTKGQENNLENKYISTLYLLFKNGLQGFFQSFYDEAKQAKWVERLKKAAHKEQSASLAASSSSTNFQNNPEEPSDLQSISSFNLKTALEKQLKRTLDLLHFKGRIRQRLEQLRPRNPLEELSAHNVIKAWANQRASFSYRDISHTQYGKLCPIETPEGAQTGLVQHLAAYAKINKEGQILTPYYPVHKRSKNNVPEALALDAQPVYLSATEEHSCYLATYDREGNYFPFLRHAQEFLNKTNKAPTHRDICKGQQLSHATALIPFLEHDDGHRALMAASMQKQALTLCKPEPPIIGTGREHFVAKNALLTKASIKREELALGTNLLVAYLPWEGYTHEDAIVISQELVDKDILTSVHSYTYDITLEEGEELQPVFRPEGMEYQEAMAVLHNSKPEDPSGLEWCVVKAGTSLSYGAALVGKQRPPHNSQSPLSLFQSQIMVDSSISFTDFPYAEKAKVEEVILLDSANAPTNQVNQIKTIRIRISFLSRIKVGDKLAGRHGNKGVVSLILPKEEMPYYYDDDDPTKKIHVQIIMDPLSIPSRMNLGQLYEAHLGRLALRLGKLEKEKKLDYDSPLYSYLLEERVPLWTGSQLGPSVPFAIPPFSSPSLAELQELYHSIGLEDSFKETLYYQHYHEDKEETIKYQTQATVGVAYILKLDHQVEEKINVRSTGKYTKIFQQPVRGRKQKGGQRMGEMELWALEAYGATKNLEECLTVKADDVIGRQQLEEQLLKEEYATLPAAHVPQAFTILQQFLNAMALKLELYDNDNATQPLSLKASTKSAPIKKAKIKLLPPEEMVQLAQSKQQPRTLISLAVPVVHPMFFKPLAELLGLKVKALRDVVYYRKYLYREIEEPFKLRLRSLNSHLSKHSRKLESLGTGAIALQKALQLLKLPDLPYQPQDIILTTLLKLPQELLPEEQKDSYQYFKEPLTVAYKRLEHQNEQLADLIKAGANEAFLNLEKCKLQAYVDGLISKGDYGLLNNVSYYKPLLQKLSHKKGILRENLLGKRINYSARSVIIADPHLKLNECGLPMVMALELFRPLILKALGDRQAYTQALNQLWQGKLAPDHRALKLLEQLVQDKVILLGRNPALHRLSLQAFNISLKNDLCIHLHPLVCPGFNADFDGDSMFLLLPLSQEAQQEAREKLLSTNNLLSPGTGEPIATPSQEMVLGIYKYTLIGPKSEEGETVGPFESPLKANGYLKEHGGKNYNNQRISLMVDGFEVSGMDYQDSVTLENTSLGLVDFNRFVIPANFRRLRRFTLEENEEGKIIFNGFDQAELEKLIRHSFLPNKVEVTTDFLSKMMHYGFQKASEAGLSFAMTDFPADFQPGQDLEQVFDQNPLNPLSIIFNSGARGKKSQWNQLRGSRGKFGNLDDKQELKNTLVVENDFYRGVTDLEFFVSCHGTRSGVSDTALGTADSGALARNLVLALQDLAIVKEDCSAEAEALPGLKLSTLVPLMEGDHKPEISKTEAEPAVLTARQQAFLVGRYLAQPVTLQNGKTLAANTLLTTEQVEQLKYYKPEELWVRSPITCSCPKGICCKCYGASPMTRKKVRIGTQVGIIAAQSLSEPTTQFTLDSIHGKDTVGEKGRNPIKQLETYFKANHKELKHRFSATAEDAKELRQLDSLIPYLMGNILAIYQANKATVRHQHLEVLLSRMLTVQGNTCEAITGIGKIMKQKPFLTQLGFENPGKVIADAVISGAVDDFSSINSRILVGKTLNLKS